MQSLSKDLLDAAQAAMRKGTREGVIRSWITRHANGEKAQTLNIKEVDELRKKLNQLSSDQLAGGDIAGSGDIHDIAGELSTAYLLQQLPASDPGRKLIPEKFASISGKIDKLPAATQEKIRGIFAGYV